MADYHKPNTEPPLSSASLMTAHGELHEKNIKKQSRCLLDSGLNVFILADLRDLRVSLPYVVVFIVRASTADWLSFYMSNEVHS